MPLRLRLRDEDLNLFVRGYAWQRFDGLDAVDGTLQLEARSSRGASRSVLALLHGRLVRTEPGGPFTAPLDDAQIRELIEYAWDEEGAQEGGGRIRITNAQYCLTHCRLPKTAAPEWAGKALDTIEKRFALGSEAWMQDWPLEVADGARVEEFCAFYDDTADPLVRFYVMQLALFSYDDQLRATRDDSASSWFDRTLRRDFALHGHTIAYWAALDRESDDLEFQSSDPEFVFAISGLLRRIWDHSLVPVDVDWPGPTQGTPAP